MTTSKAISILVTGAACPTSEAVRSSRKVARPIQNRSDYKSLQCAALDSPGLLTGPDDPLSRRHLGAEVMQGDLTDLMAMHRAIEGCARVYFGMSVSADYLSATVNTAAVVRHHGVEAFVNMSQMTVTQMSISESTDSPQHKLHLLAEQALSWS